MQKRKFESPPNTENKRVKYEELKQEEEYLKKVNQELEDFNEDEKIQQMREKRKILMKEFGKDEIKTEEKEIKIEEIENKIFTQPQLKIEEKKEEDNDSYDMFGDEEVEVDLYAKKPNQTHLDNWDDHDGYLIFKHGEIFNNEFITKGFYGKGTFSTVVQATNIKTQEQIAIKIIRNNDIMKRSGLQEIEHIQKLNETDPENKFHIIRMQKHFYHKDHLCIVFEAGMMNLREILEKFGKSNGKQMGIKLDAVRVYAYQLFLALKHLKTNKILHCDIKPDNILINEKKNLISLTDFGTVLSISECNIGKTPYLGSRYYRSPEIALGIDIDYKSDLWSAACTIYELYTGNVLFPSTSNNHMILLHMELKGLINNKLMKRSHFIENYFDSENNFLVDEIDSVSEKKIFRRKQLGV
jgi:serine/threonine-protein kinase PRP4